MKRTTRIMCAAVWIYEKNGKNNNNSETMKANTVVSKNFCIN